MPLYKGGKLVGVAAVDAALGQISQVLSTPPLLDNGYAYLIDRDGMVISHPSWAPERGWSRATFETKSHIDYVEGTMDEERYLRFLPVSAHIRTAQPDNPPSKTEWSPTGDADGLWYVFSQTVPGSPYILVMTVPKSDVIAPVTKMLDDVNNTRNASIIGFVLVSAAAVLVIIWATTYLGKVRKIQD
eukprot:SAG22_NODE_1444_length_4412_cov_2.784605_6_plen_187_part_00